MSSVKDSGELAAAANTVLENASEQKDAAVNAFKESEIEGASGAKKCKTSTPKRTFPLLPPITIPQTKP